MKQKTYRHSYTLAFLAVFLLCFGVGLYWFTSTGVKAKEAELSELYAQYDAIVQENDELNYLLNDADEDELFEQLARSRGYSYPDEKIYYDITPGK